MLHIFIAEDEQNILLIGKRQICGEAISTVGSSLRMVLLHKQCIGKTSGILGILRH